METLIKICFSLIVALVLWAFVNTAKHSANFKKGLENHLLNNSFLQHNAMNVSVGESKK